MGSVHNVLDVLTDRALGLAKQLCQRTRLIAPRLTDADYIQPLAIVFTA